MAWYKKLHWQILVGLVLGLAYGVVAASAGWTEFTSDWIAPFGTIFLNLLKLIAVPLILASLIVGVNSLSDLNRLSRIGGKTIGLYLVTTTIALTIGLVLVNTFQPGNQVTAETQKRLQETYQEEVEMSEELAAGAKDRGPLQPLVDMVPSNFFNSASDNGNMLQVVFVALLVGIGLLLIPKEEAAPLLNFFESLNSLIIRLVELVMLMAPVGVFGLLADAITSIAGGGAGSIINLLGALGFYCLTVIVGLAIMVFVVYPLFMSAFTDIAVLDYFQAIVPAQLVAFSTSSSGGTLPVTMEVTEKNLGVSEEVSSFVLPLGATINMDGTALYQSVAAVFIAQVLGIGLVLTQQLNIVLLATLASIGAAAVPSAGTVMLVVILESIGVPPAGIALIWAADRPLDMLRTTNNVTGDTMVASVVAASEGELNFPVDGVSVVTGDVQGSLQEEAAG